MRREKHRRKKTTYSVCSYFTLYNDFIVCSEGGEERTKEEKERKTDGQTGDRRQTFHGLKWQIINSDRKRERWMERKEGEWAVIMRLGHVKNVWIPGCSAWCVFNIVFKQYSHSTMTSVAIE